MRKLTKKEREAIHWDNPGIEGIKVVDDNAPNLGMDSHGCNIELCVIRFDGDEQLYAFLCRASSEETFYDDPTLVPVVARQVTQTAYVPADGSDWSKYL